MLGVQLRGFPAWFAARTYHLAMMPGAARRLRLMTDWTVGLFFGRASSELGQLGHPPSLQGYLDDRREAEPACGERAGVGSRPRGGRSRRSPSGRARPPTSRPRSRLSERAMHDGRGAPGRRAGRTASSREADIRARWLRQRSLVEFIAAQPDGRYVICEDGGGAGGLRARGALRAAWRSSPS